MAKREDQYRLMTDQDPFSLPQMDGPITPDLRRYGMPPPGTGGGAPYTPQAPYIPPNAYDVQQNKFVPMVASLGYGNDRMSMGGAGPRSMTAPPPQPSAQGRVPDNARIFFDASRYNQNIPSSLTPSMQAEQRRNAPPGRVQVPLTDFIKTGYKPPITSGPGASQVGYADQPRTVISVEKSPRPQTGIFYSRSGYEGTGQRYTPGSLSRPTDEERAGIAMSRFDDEGNLLPELAANAYRTRNGVREKVFDQRRRPSDATEIVAPTQTPKQQEFLNLAVARMQDASTRFLTPQAEAAARAAERDLQIRNEARNLRGITNRERAAYERELRSLQGPQEQERRKQEQAAERIAKASNPPQVVRGEKPPGPEEMTDRAKQYYDSVKGSVLPKTSTYLSNQLTGMNDEEAKQILSILSGDDKGIDLTTPASPNDTDMQRKRKRLYAIVLEEAGQEVADDLFDRNSKK